MLVSKLLQDERQPNYRKIPAMGEVIWEYAQVSDELAAILNKMIRSHPPAKDTSQLQRFCVAAFVNAIK